MAASLAQEILQMRHPTPRYCQSHRDGIKYEDPTPDPTRWTISPQVTAEAEEPKSEEPKAEEPKVEEPKAEELRATAKTFLTIILELFRKYSIPNP